MTRYSSLTDAVLIKLVAQKKERAFEELYNRYSSRLYNYFWRLCGSSVQAQDLVHDVFLKLIHKAHLFDNKFSFPTWLYTIAYRQFINQVRRKSHIADLSEATDKQELLQAHSDSRDVESELNNKLFSDQVFEILNDFDEDKRNTFILRYQNDLNISEIAEVLQCPVGTVKSRLHYLIKEITSRLAIK